MKIGIVVLIAVVLIIIGAAAYFMLRNKASPDTETVAQTDPQTDAVLAGQSSNVTDVVNESQVYNLRLNRPIIQAMYGIPNQTLDVTAKLQILQTQEQQIVDMGISPPPIVVTNNTMGGDPAPGSFKKLTITYGPSEASEAEV